MRKLTALFNLGTTFVLLIAIYTGMETASHKTDSTFHSLMAFFTFVIVGACLANAMLYINTLHKEIDELNSKLENNNKELILNKTE